MSLRFPPDNTLVLPPASVTLPAPVVNVHVDPPEVIVQAPDVTVEAAKAPDVTVQPPEVTVQAPEVTVEAAKVPDVTVQAVSRPPEVNVTTPAITVQSASPDVQVHVPDTQTVTIDNPVIRTVGIPDSAIAQSLFFFIARPGLVVDGNAILSGLTDYLGLWIVPEPDGPQRLPDDTGGYPYTASDEISGDKNEILFPVYTRQSQWYGSAYLRVSPHTDGVIKVSASFNVSSRHFRWFFLDGPNRLVYLLCEYYFGLPGFGGSTWIAVGLTYTTPTGVRPSPLPIRLDAQGWQDWLNDFCSFEVLPTPHSGLP